MGIYLKISDQVIKGIDETVERWTSPMVDFGIYEFKILHTGKNISQEYFTNAYVEGILGL